MLGLIVSSHSRANNDFKNELLTDCIDKLNYKITPILSIIISVILLSNNYWNHEFECLTTDDEEHFAFINGYCLAKGTVAILPNEILPQTKVDWSKYKSDFTIFYIQFLSIMIGLQGIMFIIPELVWKIVCHGKASYELMNLAETVCGSNPITPEDTEKALTDIHRKFEIKIFIHREIRQGYATIVRKLIARYLSVLSFSKRHGTWLVSWYFFIKLFYIGNCWFQLMAFQKSFDYTQDSWQTFPRLIVDILLSVKTWTETRMFPKNTVCLVDDRRYLEAINTNVYSCVIPANVLNEKLIPLVWIYVGFVTILNIWSTIGWLCLMMISRFRNQFVHDFLREFGEEVDQSKCSVFVNDYLKCDGVFLLVMIDTKCRRSFSTKLVHRIYLEFLKKQIKQSI